MEDYANRPVRGMQRERGSVNWRFVGTLTTIAVAIVLVGYIGLLSGPVDGIEEGRDYMLASLVRATDKAGKEFALIHLADRNLSKASFGQYLKDAAGNYVVKENPDLPPSTLRKVRIRVPSQKTEDGILPAYEFIQYQYWMTHKEPQVHVPIVIPKR